MEAILNVLDSYDADDECKLDVIHFGMGDISETDLSLAETFNGYINESFFDLVKAKK